MLRNNSPSHKLIGPYHFLAIGPRNSTLFTRQFFTGRCTQGRHETNEYISLVASRKKLQKICLATLGSIWGAFLILTELFERANQIIACAVTRQPLVLVWMLIGDNWRHLEARTSIYGQYRHIQTLLTCAKSQERREMLLDRFSSWARDYISLAEWAS